MKFSEPVSKGKGGSPRCSTRIPYSVSHAFAKKSARGEKVTISMDDRRNKKSSIEAGGNSHSFVILWDIVQMGDGEV